MVRAAIALGVVLQAVTGYYAFRLTESAGVPRAAALLTGTLTVVTPVVVWGAVSGMEVPLAAALVLAGLHHHFAGRTAAGPRRYLGMTLLGASALARPENLALIAVVLLGEWFGSEPIRARFARVAQGTVITALIFAPLVAFSYRTVGRPLPTTFYAKSGPGIVRAIETRDAAMARRGLFTFGPRAVANFWMILTDQFSWAACLVALGAVAAATAPPTRRMALTFLSIMIVVPFAMGLTAPQRLKPDNVRYAGQLVVLAAPLLAAGAWRLFRRPAAAVVAMALAVALTAARSVDGAQPFALSVKNVQELQVTAARWMAVHLPREAVVAVNDVGAIAYFSGRQILDLEGLVSAEVLPYRSLPDRGLRIVRDMRPDYVVVFPGWYPEIARSEELHEIHRVTITDNYISAGDTLIIYQTPWARPLPARTLQ
jgi:arabinofuranosyltransferase